MELQLDTCKICDKGPFKNYAGLSKHLYQMHRGVTNQEYYDKYLKQPGEGICVVCGKPTQFSGRLNRGYYTHCSQKCTANDKNTVGKRKATNLEVHGSEGYNNHEQTSRTKLERYGDANYANGDQIRATKEARYGITGFNNPEKRKETKKERYGTANYVNKEKCAQTKLERYGSSTYNNSDKMMATKLERYGVSNFVNPDKARETVLRRTIQRYNDILGTQCDVLGYDDRTFHCKCRECGTEFDIPINTGWMRLNRYGTKWCTVCNPPDATRSSEEGSLLEYVKAVVGDAGYVLQSDREVLDGLELDIYVPEAKLAIEFDGLYWHNELNKPNTYHLRKTEMCEAAGLHLVHVFEDEWIEKQDIVKSRISGILGKNRKIYARDCEVRDVTYSDAAGFLTVNHIQGSCISSCRLGLYHDEELVALMTFGDSRFGEGTELLRYCNKKFLSVVGGASRLFKHFVDTHPDVSMITSYADRRWSSPQAFYPKIGFTLDGVTRPSYYYIVNNTRKNRMDFTKRALVESGFSPELTEHEIMLSRKIYRIYDCGNYRYVWRRQ